MQTMDFDIGNLFYIIITLVVVIVGLLMASVWCEG